MGQHPGAMRRAGHYGMASLVYLPVGLVFVARGHPELALGGAGLTLGLAPVPDVDRRLPGVSHRGVTHTLGFVLAVALAVAVLAWYLASLRVDHHAGAGFGGILARNLLDRSRRRLAAVGFVTAVASLSSHLLADLLTPRGCRPLWPLSRQRLALGLCRYDSVPANAGLLIAGAVALGVLVAAAAGWPPLAQM